MIQPFQNSDLVLQRVLLSLQSFLVDDFDGVHLSVLPTLGQSHLREGSRAQHILHVVLVLHSRGSIHLHHFLLRLLLGFSFAKEWHGWCVVVRGSEYDWS